MRATPGNWIMTRPLKPAPDPWWWPRLTPGFVVLSVVLTAAMAGASLSRLPTGVLPIIMLGLWVPMFVIRRQRRRLANRILARKGVTCPCCLRALTADTPDCLHCGMGLGRSVYVDYWTLASNKPGKSESWWRTQNHAKGQRGRTTHLTMMWFWQLGFLLGCFVVGSVGLILWRPSLLLTMQWLQTLPFVFTALVGIEVMTRYGRRRLGDSLHCRRCDYQIDPDRLSMPTCPECGGGLAERGQTVAGQRVGHGGYTLLGILIFTVPVLVPMTAIFTDEFGKLSPSNYLPVSLYVDTALSDNPDYKTWQVLESRYAQPEDVRRLADKVLAQAGGDIDPDDTPWSYSMNKALAFQLDGPNVPEDLRLEVALSLMQDHDGARLFKLRDWQAQYLTSVVPGSSEYRELLSAAEASFASSHADYRVTRWLEIQRGERLTTYNEFGRFCQSLLVIETIQTDEGNALVIRTNPNTTLSVGLRPDEPVSLYLKIIGPEETAATTTPSDLRLWPFKHLGQSHTLATIPIDDVAFDPADYRLHYVVYVGETPVPLFLMQWHDGWSIPPSLWDTHEVFGPMQLGPGWGLADDLRIRPRRRGPRDPLPPSAP